MSPLAVALLAAVVGVAGLVALAGDALVATVAFAAYGLGLAVLWAVFRAPDVGLTEAAVGAGVTTALFLAALSGTTRPSGDRPLSLAVSPRAAAGVATLVVALLATVPALPPVGRPTAEAAGGATAFYLARTAALGIENVVTAVLVVFRGFDTLGEVAVVFAAGVAVLLVFGAEVAG